MAAVAAAARPNHRARSIVPISDRSSRSRIARIDLGSFVPISDRSPTLETAPHMPAPADRRRAPPVCPPTRSAPRFRRRRPAGHHLLGRVIRAGRLVATAATQGALFGNLSVPMTLLSFVCFPVGCVTSQCCSPWWPLGSHAHFRSSAACRHAAAVGDLVFPANRRIWVPTRGREAQKL